MDLKDHLNIAHTKNPVGKYKCPHCGKRYKYVTGFKYHLRIHTGKLSLKFY